MPFSQGANQILPVSDFHMIRDAIRLDTLPEHFKYTQQTIGKVSDFRTYSPSQRDQASLTSTICTVPVAPVANPLSHVAR